MNKFKSILSLIALCIVFTGCPYESAVPIDAPSIKINPNVIGKWLDNKSRTDEYTVSKLDDYNYKILKASNDTDKVQEFIAYASVVNKSTFLNLWENLPYESKYKFSLFKLDIDGANSIKLSEVTENIDEVFNNSEGLKSFIEANMNNSYFYGKDEIELVRMK